jgi:hypothetical protein
MIHQMTLTIPHSGGVEFAMVIMFLVHDHQGQNVFRRVSSVPSATERTIILVCVDEVSLL